MERVYLWECCVARGLSKLWSDCCVWTWQGHWQFLIHQWPDSKMMLLKTDNSKILILVSTAFQDANIHITDFKPPLSGTVLKHSAVGSHTLPPASGWYSPETLSHWLSYTASRTQCLGNAALVDWWVLGELIKSGKRTGQGWLAPCLHVKALHLLPGIKWPQWQKQRFGGNELF